MKIAISAEYNVPTIIALFCFVCLPKSWEYLIWCVSASSFLRSFGDGTNYCNQLTNPPPMGHWLTCSKNTYHMQ